MGDKDQADRASNVVDLRGVVDRELIDKVEVKLEAHLGTATMTVAELSQLGPDSIVALDTGLGAKVAVRLNGTTIAWGEIVAVGDKFGVRLTDVGR